MEAKLQTWLYEVYSDKNLIKMDYDSANDDEALQSIQDRAKRAAEIQPDEKQEESEEVQLKIEEAFNKIEIEGIEEITGNYNPEE